MRHQNKLNTNYLIRGNDQGRFTSKVLALWSVLCALAAPVLAQQQPGTSSVLVTSPGPDSIVTGQYINISLAVSPLLDPQAVRVTVDGIDISADFSRPKVCEAYECTETATVGVTDGVNPGYHTIQVSTNTPGEPPQVMNTVFQWQPKAAFATTARLPVTLGLTTTGPGGRSPWIALSNDALDGTTTYYPLCSAVALLTAVIAHLRLDCTKAEPNDSAAPTRARM